MATVGSLAVVLTASATDFERTMGRAARSVKSTEKEFMRSARRMEDIGRKWTMGVTVPIVAGFTAVTKAAIDWEDAFAGVRKTVAATEEQFSELDQSLRKMTERIPATHREIGQIAETAGQLGIQTENIEDFTETMAMLGTATNMASDEAAIALAQMANVMQTGQQNFDRLGSTVVHLGNNLATMESNIVEFGQRIAGAGKIAGLTEAQVLSIGGAFASVGVNAEAGGTAVSKVLQSMTEAVATGNKNLQGFAAVSGMSAAEFATSWQEDAGMAFTRFIEGIGASGDQAFAIFRSLGLTDQRMLRGFLSVAGAGDLMRKSIDMGTKAWEENVALINEANERYKTAASRLQMLRNRAYNAAISFGGAFAPLLESAMEKVEALIRGLQRLAEWFERLPGPIRVATGNMLLFLAAIGPAHLAFALLYRTIAGGIGLIATLQAFAASAAFAFASWRMGAATLAESLSYLVGGPIKLVILGIGAAIAAAILLAANWDKLSGYAAAAWGAISAAVLYGASLVVRGIGLILSAIAAIVPAVQGAAQAVLGLADSLKSSAGQSLASAKSAAGAASTAAKAAAAQKAIADAGHNAAGTQEELAEGIEGVGKAAMANLQSFDEVHQMQDSMGSAAPTLEDFAIPEIAIPEIPSLGGGIVSGIGDQLAKAADTAVSAWGRITEAVNSFGATVMEKFPVVRTVIESIGKVVGWVRENWDTIGPVVEGAVGIALAIMNPWLVVALAVAGVAFLIIENWDKIKPVLQKVWDNIKKVALPIWEQLKKTAKQVFQSILDYIQTAVERSRVFWDRWGGIILAITEGVWNQVGIIIETAIRIIGDIIGAVLAIVSGDWETAWKNIKDIGLAVWDFLVATWENLKWTLSTIWEIIKNKAIAVWENIKTAIITPIQAAWDWLVATWNTIGQWLSDKWDWIKDVANSAWQWISDNIIFYIQTAWDWLVEAWNTIGQWLSEKWDWVKEIAGTTWNLISGNITGAIQGAWTWLEDTWNSIANFLDRTWEGIKKGASDIWKGIANTIIGFINKIVGALNSMIKEMNKIHFSIPDWVPKIGGKSWGFNLPTIAEIPMLAEGGIITAPTLAMVGERGPEAVIPLSGSGNFVESIASAVERGSYAGTVQGMRVASASGGQQADQQEVVLRIDSTTLARLILPAIIKEGQRQGLNLVVQGG